MSTPNSRPVHPCVLSVFEGTTGVEYSTWARVTDQSLEDGSAGRGMPDLVTAHASSLSIYRIDESTGKMLLVHTYSNMAGNVCFLETLRVNDWEDGDGDPEDDRAGLSGDGGGEGPKGTSPTNQRQRRTTPSSHKRRRRRPDALLVGFCGHPRLAIVHVQPDLLLATTLLDLTPAITDCAYGAITPLEHDMTASLFQRDETSSHHHQATVSVVLGGGISVVCLELRYHSSTGGWRAVEEPYVLPLSTLARAIDRKTTQSGAGGQQRTNSRNNNRGDASNALLTQSIVTGFGDILGTAFLPGYMEPTMVVLHSNPNVGRVCPGRLGRDTEGGKGGTRYSLVLTAVTVTVTHQRSALLWSTEVPADALSVYTCPLDAPSGENESRGGAGGTAACLVHCVNSVVWVSNTGQIQQCLAVNGWVSSTLSTAYNSIVTANQWPFPKLSVQLDGARFTPLDATTWFVVLRRGQVYLLQRDKDLDSGRWSFMPLYQTVGAVGECSGLSCCPMGVYSALSATKDKGLFYSPPKAGEAEQQLHDIGLLFVASRLGDSSLLGYALGKTSVAEALKTEPGLGDPGETVKTEQTIRPRNGTNESDANSPKTEATAEDGGTPVGDDDYERILQLEEEALYGNATTSDGNVGKPDLVPPSDDDDDDENGSARSNSRQSGRKRARFSNLLVVRTLHVLDSLTALGPLGPACSGPLSSSPEVAIDPTMSTSNTTSSVATTGHVFPCGYGSSGGIALLSIPGRDDRNLLAEADCVNAKALFSLPRRGLVLMAMLPEDGGTKVFRIGAADSATKGGLEEIDLADWCPSEDTRDFFTTCHLLAASDLTEDSFLVLAASPNDENSKSYFVITLREQQQQGQSTTTIRMAAAYQLDIPQSEIITRAKTVEDRESGQVFLSYTLTTGEAKVAVISSDGSVDTKHSFPSIETAQMDTSTDLEEDAELSEEEKFYAGRTIVSVDMFKAPRSFFVSEAAGDPEKNEDTIVSDQEMEDGNHLAEAEGDDYLDEDDRDLYYQGTPTDGGSEKKKESDDNGCDEAMTSDESDVWYFATSRQSGELDVFLFSDLETPVWSCIGFGHGAPSLDTHDPSSFRNPIGHKVCTREIKFFFCGPSSDEWKNRQGLVGPRPFCVMLETNDGDVQIYEAKIHHRSLKLLSFRRIPLKDVSRQSQESTKHFSKLRRKKIVSAKDATESSGDFQYNRLFPFRDISGQDGVFALVTRPFWLVAERGRPTVLHHRCKHVAPTGAKPRPITGFCSGLKFSNSDQNNFVTLHERVGRVGSQRMTLFDGILNLASKNSLLPGGGMFVEKIPFGVTVRKIQFIDDDHASTGSRPLYAVLVSREYEADLSELNDDGMTDEERQRLAEEKESAKIQRQVEADLGGFDVEQEWVEEIERENCFKINRNLGGAPPVPSSAYSLWIVDVANGWQVIDSYELEECEHGTSMEVMTLTKFLAEPGTDYNTSEEELESKLFIAVGAGTINKDGEDVACKGRVLLFEVTRPKESGVLPIAELNFVYEKKIFHGPVTTLSCLNIEGKSRLLIGAGADINVEQWGNDKLTQVGFFRATMQVLDIKLFKNFIVLSDAYDSLYFLVWRESDKSLTMLAKDYDPIPVYCSGIISRGGSLDFVCHDDRQNLQFFQYAPGDPAARGGNKLVCRADFHLGSQTTDLRSHFCRSSLLINSSTPSSALAALKQQDTFFGKADDDQRFALTFGTTDGGYHSVVPLSEPVYWRMTALQSVLANALESDCALSRRAWRLYRRSSRRGGCRNNDRKKGVIDGDLVMQYTDLSKAEQEDLASAIGSTVDLILDNLLELRCSTMVI
ncbi:unnamed protein product [Pseudo-nitzschia multistriata]|uniref:RSE1/DDB1/CPSF1 C-terminal domain-containing protein n=1 Tax=Pseudo-nitzschia multistriata TaxID=183589 RepID=A0A448ZID6_9STRA|nr:unnamed protein product [Pseudo-nitzschia multistriata]